MHPTTACAAPPDDPSDHPADEHAARAASGLPAAVVRGPADAVCALPHLLGFVPQDSLVAIWVRDGCIALTQRLDLPPGAAAVAAAGELVATARQADADSVLVVICADVDTPPVTELPHAALAIAVAAAAEASGVDVLDALLTDGARYASYLCADACCPPEGRVVTAADRRRMADAFGGAAPQARRADLDAELAPDVQAQSIVDPLIDERESDLQAEIASAVERARRAAREAWRDAQINAIESILHGGGDDDETGIAPGELARVLVGLRDVRIRDTIVWELAQDDPLGTGQGSTLAVLVKALRAGPPGYVAPVATVLALARWQCGDGTRAVMALERALADEPDYPLALLAAHTIRAGTPPGSWRELLQGMPRAQCRVPEDPGSREAGTSV